MLFSVSTVQMNAENQPVTQELTLNTNEVFFVFRPPMHQETVISTSVGMIKTISEIPQEVLDTFAKFDTPDGVPLYANTTRVVLTHSPQLGIHVIVFPGGAQAMVKEVTGVVHAAILGNPHKAASNILLG